MSLVTKYAATLAGHSIELEFDQKLLVLNRANLLVDGEKVDSTQIFYGKDDLTATLEDGTEVVIRIHSGMVGELTRAQLKREDGSWEDLAVAA